jgi:leucyl aminopeptidase
MFAAPSSPGGSVCEGALALFLFAGEPLHPGILDQDSVKWAALLLEDPSFKAKKGKIVRLPLGGAGYSSLYLVGLGERKEDSPEKTEDTLRSRSAELLRRCRAEGVEKITISLPDSPSSGMSRAVAEGAELGAYFFGKYKNVPEDERLPEPGTLVLLDGVEEGLARGRMLACSQNWARDLANEPGNGINPVNLAAMAVQWGKEFGLDVAVWDEEKILEEGMGGLYAVGMGSARPPRLIHMVWKPREKAVRKIALVGKGITFDSGGLNIKTGDFMRSMKGDKSGACNVFAVLRGLAKMNVPCEVHGIVAAAENMPGGTSFRPDDILRLRNGKTVEIDNTDAEGRLVLADALCFACEQQPDVVIDMATLTGACVVALGQNMAGLFTPDDSLAADFLEASSRTGERFWRLPVDDERIAESMKSPVADLVNSGSRYGGAIFAARFLKEFVGDGIPWMHLDIAGVDMQKDEYSVYTKGATGFAVRTCMEYILSLADRK